MLVAPLKQSVASYARPLGPDSTLGAAAKSSSTYSILSLMPLEEGCVEYIRVHYTLTPKGFELVGRFKTIRAWNDKYVHPTAIRPRGLQHPTAQTVH